MLSAFLIVTSVALSLVEVAANTYEERYISVPVVWKIHDKYDNYNVAPVTKIYTYVSGIYNRQSNSKTIVATHNASSIVKGQFFRMVSLQLSYTYTHKSTTVVMSEREIYSSETMQTTVTIPPRSTFRRWQLVADVAGTRIENSHIIDVINDTRSPPPPEMGRATVLVPRRIIYGRTRLRLKHSDRDKYLTVVRRKNWPAATLGDSSRYIFLLCHDSRGNRIKTLNSTDAGYVYAYASVDGGVYFDKHRQAGYSYDRNVDKQYWSISKEEPLYDGDRVTFKNRYFDKCGLVYSKGRNTDVYCIKGLEDQWLLEIVNVADFPAKQC